jgi:hypothetical protein
MAKGLQLVDTEIIELNVLVYPDGSDATVRTRFRVLDDTGEKVRTAFTEEKFSLMSAQKRGSLNNFLRLDSQDLNIQVVAENKPSWVDL